MSFAKKGESIKLNVDNTVALSYLKKWGGKKQYLNDILQPLLHWCWERTIQLDVQWVPSSSMEADVLTRWDQDRGDYTLNNNIFQTLLVFFKHCLQPDTDMFASSGNKKISKFVTRYPHFQALKFDALNCDLGDLTAVYANPP
jgi:hypothetical protein